MLFDINVEVYKTFIWSTSTLDGACATIILGNMFKNIEYRYCFFGDFETQYNAWAVDNLENYNKVFVIGMSLNQSLVNKLDDSRVIFISNKLEILNLFDSTLIHENYTSISKLIYKKFKEKVNFDTNLKKLIGYVDDYIGNTYNYEESSYLNAIYRKSGYDKFTKFVDRFWNGFDGFTDTEVKLHETFVNEIDVEFKQLELFKGEFKKWSVIMTFSKMAVDEIKNRLLDKYSPDIIMVVNTTSNYVSFRKNKGSVVDLKFLAEHFCDGGGSDMASGGKITKTFLEFTENMTSL
jgi:hypothetical protein